MTQQGWEKIDAAEVERGARRDRARAKIATRGELLAIASEGLTSNEMA